MSEFSEPCRPLQMRRRVGLASKAAWLRWEKELGLGRWGKERGGMEAHPRQPSQDGQQ